MKPTIAVIAALTAIALAACSSGRPAAVTTPPVQSGSPAAPAVPATAPVTPSAVRAAATAYFDLYAAGQYAATWPLLSPNARRVIPEQVWVKVHDKCISQAEGLAYKVGRVELAGRTAVVNVSLAGAASALGSEEQTFAYSGGQWEFAPSDLSVYRGHTVAQTVAALKAQNVCTG